MKGLPLVQAVDKVASMMQVADAPRELNMFARGKHGTFWNISKAKGQSGSKFATFCATQRKTWYLAESRTIARIWYWMHCIVSCLQCVSCDAFNFSLYWTCFFASRFPNTTYNPTYNPLWEHMSISPSFSTAFFFQRNLEIAQQKKQPAFPSGLIHQFIGWNKGHLDVFTAIFPCYWGRWIQVGI